MKNKLWNLRDKLLELDSLCLTVDFIYMYERDTVLLAVARIKNELSTLIEEIEHGKLQTEDNKIADGKAKE